MSVLLARRLAALAAPRYHAHHGQVALQGDRLLDLACALLPTRPQGNVKAAVDRHLLSEGMLRPAVFCLEVSEVSMFSRPRPSAERTKV